MKLPECENLNWLQAHNPTDLDQFITPLTAAAFLGRKRIVELLLENVSLNLNMPTH
jgi:hypothetical protein